MRRLLCALPFLLAACGPTVGDPCTVAKECGPGLCVNRSFAPGGYCTQACTLGAANACPAGTVCVADAIGRDSPGCMRSCSHQRECREGYVCQVEKDSATPICVGPQGI